MGVMRESTTVRGVFHFGDDGLRIDVHNIQRFAAVGGFYCQRAFWQRRDTAADKQRQGGQPLHPRIMDFGAKRLISGIIGTGGYRRA